MLKQLINSLNHVLLGKEKEIRLLLNALLADGHVLIEDVPGTGKTTLAKALAVLVGADFSRIQFTPDLLPGDVTGGAIYRQNTGTFEVHRGPIFTQILLADEINRASPRTQSSLLEAMEERQVSLEGSRHELPALFMVLATQNPVEFHGVFPLPEAQMDRFIIRLTIGYPDEETELNILRSQRFTRPLDSLQPVITPDQILILREKVKKTHVEEALERYIISIVLATRSHAGLRLAASPRAGLAVLRMAQANACLDERDYVTPEDIQFVLKSVMAHRIFAIESGFGVTEGILQEIVKNIPIPR
ncbi:MAG TPA: MoxR family ATPase [Fibrobacteraceae bacterium]|jgi:MoxR-like ATPase|nr:MoxR family ATPase [Fibrobacter sp.]HPW93869.1 MoxR family ATPase [Fibrobacteraceae bacterium]HQB64789.1 MoxR family ATPase [Fibrobacteraceae bacterium]